MRRAIGTTVLSLLFICILAIYSNKIQADYPPHQEGQYVLEFVIKNPDNSVTLIQMALYQDPQWAYMVCNAQRENIMKRADKFLKKYNATVSCAKFYGNEV